MSVITRAHADTRKTKNHRPLSSDLVPLKKTESSGWFWTFLSWWTTHQSSNIPLFWWRHNILENFNCRVHAGFLHPRLSCFISLAVCDKQLQVSICRLASIAFACNISRHAWQTSWDFITERKKCTVGNRQNLEQPALLDSVGVFLTFLRGHGRKRDKRSQLTN